MRMNMYDGEDDLDSGNGGVFGKWSLESCGVESFLLGLFRTT